MINIEQSISYVCTSVFVPNAQTIDFELDELWPKTRDTSLSWQCLVRRKWEWEGMEMLQAIAAHLYIQYMISWAHASLRDQSSPWPV